VRYGRLFELWVQGGVAPTGKGNRGVELSLVTLGSGWFERFRWFISVDLTWSYDFFALARSFSAYYCTRLIPFWIYPLLFKRLTAFGVFGKDMVAKAKGESG
jgi:hypothetical protein